jgi:hypothetical protein
MDRRSFKTLDEEADFLFHYEDIMDEFWARDPYFATVGPDSTQYGNLCYFLWRLGVEINKTEE